MAGTGRPFEVKDLTGTLFTRLKVISFHAVIKGHAFWNCQCECGTEKIIAGKHLKAKKGNTRSCGCLASESAGKRWEGRFKTHGYARTSTYHIWTGIRQRCYNEKNPAYEYYGARGIRVCDRWNRFENFLEDMGERPEGKSLDRIDNDGPYSEENCRWASHQEQMNNTGKNIRIEFNGLSLTVSQWARRLNIPQYLLAERLRNGKPFHEAIVLC